MYYRWIGGILLSLALGISSVQAAPVRTVYVDLRSTTGVIPSSLKARMEASIQGAASYLYEGKDTLSIEQSMGTYKKATVDVVDRILYGYTVKDMNFHIAEDMSLQITLEPYGHVIRKIDTVINYGNLSAYGKELVEKDLGNLEGRMEQVLLGASLDSIDWAAPVAQKSIRNELEYKLPEFTPQVDISVGEESTATIYLVPNGDSIRRTEVNIVSNTLPSSLFYSTKLRYETLLQSLEGLPVQFVRRHKPMIEARLQEELNGSRAVKQFGITMIPELHIGTQTQLHIRVDSSKYILRGEGYLDMGRDRDSVGLKLYTGIHEGRHQFYVETEFLPNRLVWKFKPSYLYQVTKDTQMGYQYIAPKGEHRFMVRQDIQNKWHIRYHRDIQAKKNEFALAYDLHSYLTLEYVWADDDKWLRLIGHI